MKGKDLPFPASLEQDRYTFVKQIGEGGQAKVALYNDAREKRKVVLKAYSLKALSAEDVERLKREEIVLQQLQHPYVVQCYGSILAEEQLFVVQEFVEGRTLQRILESAQYGADEPFCCMINAKACMKQDIVHAIASQLLQTLAALHAMTIVHRDVKPDNIILNEETLRITLIDFGTAKSQVVMGNVSTYIGTHYFMSPQFFTGKPYTDKTDVWSCGATLYWLLSGQLPFGEVFNFKRVIQGRHEKLPDAISNEMKSLVYDCLKCEEADRLSSLLAIKQYFPECRELRLQRLATQVTANSEWIVYVFYSEGMRRVQKQSDEDFICAQKGRQIRLTNGDSLAKCEFSELFGRDVPNICKYCLNCLALPLNSLSGQTVFQLAHEQPDSPLSNGITVANELDVVEYLLQNRQGERQQVRVQYCEYDLPQRGCKCW